MEVSRVLFRAREGADRGRTPAGGHLAPCRCRVARDRPGRAHRGREPRRRGSPEPCRRPLPRRARGRRRRERGALMSFRGASAEAFASLTTDLDGTVSGAPETVARVGGDLFSVSGVLRTEAGLRRVLTDVSVAPGAKAGLVRDIFGDKAVDSVVTLVASAVAKRWTVGRDLPDALARLGVLATVKSSGSATGRLSDELFEIGQLIKKTPELRDAYSDTARQHNGRTPW